MTTHTKSQTQQIEKHLLKGGKLTPLLALSKFGCFRLSARINDLRNDGYPVETRMIVKNGKRIAEYSLDSSYLAIA